MKQLDIFDFTEETEKAIEQKISKRLDVGDSVIVSADPEQYADDPETYYYISDFKGKKGTLTEIIKGQSAVSFKVVFPKGNIGVFYEHEITKLGGIQ